MAVHVVDELPADAVDAVPDVAVIPSEPPAVACTVRPAVPRHPFPALLRRACAVLRCPKAAFPIRVSGITVTHL